MYTFLLRSPWACFFYLCAYFLKSKLQVLSRLRAHAFYFGFNKQAFCSHVCRTVLILAAHNLSHQNSPLSSKLGLVITVELEVWFFSIRNWSYFLHLHVCFLKRKLKVLAQLRLKHFSFGCNRPYFLKHISIAVWCLQLNSYWR